MRSRPMKRCATASIATATVASTRRSRISASRVRSGPAHVRSAELRSATRTAMAWVSVCSGGGSGAGTLDGGSVSSPYPSDASPSNKKACNGHDLTATAGGTDDDALDVTGAYSHCYTSLMGGDVFDLSGNAK